jgi:hypothetical protein
MAQEQHAADPAGDQVGLNRVRAIGVHRRTDKAQHDGAPHQGGEIRVAPAISLEAPGRRKRQAGRCGHPAQHGASVKHGATSPAVF